MVTDQEPRYRLKDPSTGDIVGTLFAESDGTLTLQEGTSGDGNELSLGTDGSLNPKKLGDDRYYAGAYDGGDADARLDNALSAAEAGSVIYLEEAEYTAPRTVSQQLRFVGTAGEQSGPTTIQNWTLNGRTTIEHATFFDVTDTSLIELNAEKSMIRDCAVVGSSTLRASADEVRIYGIINDSTVEFASGTSDGVAGIVSGNSVIDNGSNRIL